MSIEDKAKLAEHIIKTLEELRISIDNFCQDQELLEKGSDEWHIARNGRSAKMHLSDLIRDIDAIYSDLVDMKCASVLKELERRLEEDL